MVQEIQTFCLYHEWKRGARQRSRRREDSPRCRTSGSGDFRLPAQGIDFERLERDLVVQALERTGGNQTRAATLLGMKRDQIRYRIEKFGLDHIRPERSGSRRS
jgi:two-component system, NtrC family, response regulator AtoC